MNLFELGTTFRLLRNMSLFSVAKLELRRGVAVHSSKWAFYFPLHGGLCGHPSPIKLLQTQYFLINRTFIISPSIKIYFNNKF